VLSFDQQRPGPGLSFIGDRPQRSAGFLSSRAFWCCLHIQKRFAEASPPGSQALYGNFAPTRKGEKSAKVDQAGCGFLSWCCGGKRADKPSKGEKGRKKKDSSQSLVDVHDAEELQLMPMKWHAKRFGVCHNFVMTTMELDGGCPVSQRVREWAESNKAGPGYVKEGCSQSERERGKLGW
jgi:hypothetical protein